MPKYGPSSKYCLIIIKSRFSLRIHKEDSNGSTLQWAHNQHLGELDSNILFCNQAIRSKNNIICVCLVCPHQFSYLEKIGSSGDDDQLETGIVIFKFFVVTYTHKHSNSD